MMRSASVVLLPLMSVACGGVGPAPDEMERRVLPVVELGEAQRRRVDSLTDAALGHVRAGDFDQARRAAEKALDIDPRAPRARAVRGRCLMQTALAELPPTLNLWQEAEGELRLAARLAPADPEVARLHAVFLEADGHTSRAAEVLDAALEHSPSHEGCLRLAARAHYELGEERLALPLIERLIELGVDDPPVLYRLAQCRLRLAITSLGEAVEEPVQRALLESAVASFGRYRDAAPQDAAGFTGEAYARLTLLQFGQNAPEQPSDRAELRRIIDLCRRAGELSTVSPEPLFNLGVALSLDGDVEGAVRAYRVALDRDPDHLPSLLNIVAELAAAGRDEEARPFCQRALQLDLGSGERARLQAWLEKGPVRRP